MLDVLSYHTLMYNGITNNSNENDQTHTVSINLVLVKHLNGSFKEGRDKKKKIHYDYYSKISVL